MPTFGQQNATVKQDAFSAWATAQGLSSDPPVALEKASTTDKANEQPAFGSSFGSFFVNPIAVTAKQEYDPILDKDLE